MCRHRDVQNCHAILKLGYLTCRSDSGYVGNVVSNGSLSKVFGPGLRIGWQEVPLAVKRIVVERYLRAFSIKYFL